MDITNTLEQIKNNLTQKGYSIQENVAYGDDHFRLVGKLSKFELSKFGVSDYFVVVKELTEPTLEQIRAFSNQTYVYADQQRSGKLPPGFFASYWTFSVALVASLSAEVKTAIQHTAPPQHWASAEFPVVIDLAAGQSYYFQDTPVWGAAYFAGFRQFASELIPK